MSIVYQSESLLEAPSNRHCFFRGQIRSLFLNVIGVMTVMTLSFMTGLIIYAQYEGCDPLTQGCVKKHDQV